MVTKKNIPTPFFFEERTNNLHEHFYRREKPTETHGAGSRQCLMDNRTARIGDHYRVISLFFPSVNTPAVPASAGIPGASVVTRYSCLKQHVHLVRMF
jgi:hypothetical protein